MAKLTQPRKRRTTRPIEDLPNLFDSVEIDMTRPDIAGNVLERAERQRHVSESANDQALEINSEALKRPEAIRFLSFGSGSSGNCCYIGTSRGGILIDAGVDNKKVEKDLKDNGIDMATIAGIILTHDHSDHVRFAYSLLRANKHLRLFCTPRALNGLLRRHSISRRIKDYHKAIYKEIPFEAGGLTITAFETSHDGSDNMGFSIERDNHKFVIVTDTGYITERADFYLRRARYAVIETDYDLNMLHANPTYPEYLKARIAGPSGHMDNADTASYLANILSDTENPTPLRHIFLCHLSELNNTPEIAMRAVRKALEEIGLNVGDATGSPVAISSDIQLAVLPRFAPSPLYIFR